MWTKSRMIAQACFSAAVFCGASGAVYLPRLSHGSLSLIISAIGFVLVGLSLRLDEYRFVDASRGTTRSQLSISHP